MFASSKGLVGDQYADEDLLENTYLDEVIGYASAMGLNEIGSDVVLCRYSMALFGCLYQLYTGFHVIPFPISLALLPLDIVEFFLEWSIFSG